MSVHDGHAALNPHLAPEATSFLAAASTSSHVVGARSGKPAFLKRSLL